MVEMHENVAWKKGSTDLARGKQKCVTD
jgi:hypothetical protein